MSVFAASKQGMSDAAPAVADGEEVSLSDQKEERDEQIRQWAQDKFNDLESSGNPASQ